MGPLRLLGSWPSLATAVSLVRGRVTWEAVQKDARHFLSSMGRWRPLSLWGPGGTEPLILFTTWCPSSVVFIVGCLGMRPGLGVQLLVCQADGSCSSSRGTSRSPWLAFQGYAGGAAGRSLGPQLPCASCLSFYPSFSVSVLAACQPCTPVWELDMPTPRTWVSLPPHGCWTCSQSPQDRAVPL